MITSDKGVDLIKSFEGFRNKPYQDIVGKWTVGYGHLMVEGDGTKVGDIISPVTATSLLKSDLKQAENCVNTNVKVPLGQNQFDALVSFVYNLGCGNFKSSTLLKKINLGDIEGAAQEFLKWNKAGGVISAGINHRRHVESCLFISGEYSV
jgi:lysozyme